MKTLRRLENVAAEAADLICIPAECVTSEGWIKGMPGKSQPNPLSENPLEEFTEYWKLSVRCRNRLLVHGIGTLKQLLDVSDEELMRISHFGVKCLEEVRAFRTLFPTRKAGSEKGIAWPRPQTGGRGRIFRFDRMDLFTKDCLSEVGISDEATLHESSLRGVMEALMYDPECLYEVWINCNLPRPTDADEILQLLCVLSQYRKIYEYKLDMFDEYSSRLAHLSDLARSRIQEGSLHRQAFMSFVPLQSQNIRLKPPAGDLLELLDRAERGAVRLSRQVLGGLEASLVDISVESDLDALLTTLNEREIYVLRHRCTPVRETLMQIAAQLDVSRERVRQIQEDVGKKLKESYINQVPLAGLRSAQLLVAEERANSEEQIEAVLKARNLIADGNRIGDFIAVWNVLDEASHSVIEALVKWKILDEKAFRFPEDLRLSLKTGYTKAQGEIDKFLMPQVRKRLGRSGFFRLDEVIGHVFRGNPPETADVEYILGKHGCEPVGDACWIGPDSGKDVPGKTICKMLFYCGDLNLDSLHYGLARHQSRLEHPVPPPDVLRAMLERRSYVRELEDGRFQLVPESCDVPELARSESIWMELVRKHGPVITFGEIDGAFERAGLTRVSAAVLCARSALVVKLKRDRYCLPGEVAGLSHEVVPPEGDLSALHGTLLHADEVDEILHGCLAMDTEAPYALNLYLPESRWTGKVSATLDWEEEVSVRTRYLAGDDVTIAGSQHFPIRHPDWRVFATLTDGRRIMKVIVPPLPEKRSLLFLASNGNNVKNWRGVQEHLVLMPENLFDEQDAQLLFEDLEVLEREHRHLKDHRLMRVRVRRSIRGCSLREIEEAAHRMGMPGLSKFHRTGVRLVGSHVYEPDIYNPHVRSSVFATTDPPLLEISGCDDEPVRIELYGETTGDRGAGEVLLDSVDVTLDGTHRIVEVFSGEPSAGRYRVRVTGCSDLTFRVIHQFERTLESTPADIVVDVSERGDLSVKAWPHASLELRTTSNGFASFTERIYADEHGDWRGTLQGFSSLAQRQEAEISVSWKGLIVKRFPLCASAAKRKARFSWREFSSEDILVLEQEASADAPDILCAEETYILGQCPWLGEVWEPTVRNIPGYGRRVVVNGVVDPGWSVELDEDDPQKATVNRVENNRRVWESWLGAGDVLDTGDEDGIERWRVLQNVLREQPLAPGLRLKLGVGDLRDTLKQCVEKFPSNPIWRPLTEDLLERLAEWEKYGLDLPVVPFAPGKSPANEIGVNPGFSTLTGNATELLENGMTDLVMYSDQYARRTRSRIISELGGGGTDGGTRKLCLLEAGDPMCACMKCGRYMLQGEFQTHVAAVKGQGRCNSKSFKTVAPGEVREIDLMVLLNPESLLLASRRLVLSDVGGEEVPGFAEDWLELLKELMPDHIADAQEFEFWIEAVCESLMTLKRFSVKPRLERASESQLAHLGRSSLPYRGGMELLSNWIGNEMEVR